VIVRKKGEGEDRVFSLWANAYSILAPRTRS
jgi:hypothetical protein